VKLNPVENAKTLTDQDFMKPIVKAKKPNQLASDNLAKKKTRPLTIKIRKNSIFGSKKNNIN
jgi:hypothetical protein